MYPLLAPVQFSLPPQLRPHDFLALSVALTFLFMILDLLAVPPAVIAIILSVMVSS